MTAPFASLVFVFAFVVVSLISRTIVFSNMLVCEKVEQVLFLIQNIQKLIRNSWLRIASFDPCYVKIIFCANPKMLKIIKIFITRICIYKKQGQRFIFVRYSNIIHFINITIFRGTNIFGVIIIFWVYIVKLIYWKF